MYLPSDTLYINPQAWRVPQPPQQRPVLLADHVPGGARLLPTPYTTQHRQTNRRHTPVKPNTEII
uniref:SFRICE_012363 n=1 Tax=Spodoptera frugiperda TaxID=7108 RepID=A0A2H1V0Z3_SPOFR